MTCTVVRLWTCCHGCSKTSSQFKTKENVLSKLCIPAMHIENLSKTSKRKKNRIGQGLAYCKPSSISFPWAHLSPVSNYWGTFLLLDDHHFLPEQCHPPGRKGCWEQTGRETDFHFSSRKVWNAKEDKQVLVSEQVFISKQIIILTNSTIFSLYHYFWAN